jgi:hypothetical protein
MEDHIVRLVALTASAVIPQLLQPHAHLLEALLTGDVVAEDGCVSAAVVQA